MANPKKLAAIIIVFLVLGILAAGQIALHKQEKVVTTPPQQPPAPVFVMDPEISRMADQFGIDKKVLAEARPVFGDAKAACGKDFTGCYNGQLILTRGAAVEVMPHEYLHHIWTRHMTQAERDHFGGLASQFYERNKGVMGPRMAKYADNPSNFTNELHSVECTEVTDSRLPAELLAHCRQWIPNRNALPSFF